MKACLIIACAATYAHAAVLENESLRVEIDEATAGFCVRDKRIGRTWVTLPETNATWTSVRAAGEGLEARAAALDAPARLAFALEGDELVCTLDAPAAAKLRGALAWPPALAAKAEERILLPHGCGFAFPCDRADLGEGFPNRMQVYTRNFNLGFWAHYAERDEADGSISPDAGYVALLETPEDAQVDFSVRTNGLRQLGVVWQADRGAFGYARRLRYVFQPKCDAASAARRYRKDLAARGDLVTLEARKRRNPRLAAAIDDLVGAPDVWYWEIEGDKAKVARELKAMGMKSFLFCFATRKDLGVWRTADEVAAVAALPGVIPCEYDVYQDTMESRFLDKIDYVRPYWSTEAADADDIVYGADGKPARGWRVSLKGEADGSKKSIGVAIICEQKSPAYCAKRLAAELPKFTGYRARFLDVSGTSLRPCYNPKHPHGRRESAIFRRKLFSTVEDAFGLICGTEDNLACFAPVTTYTEGVMSAPNHYRVDGGRLMWKLYDDVPEKIARGMDETCRVPLWELVFHGCTVSYWYWCDYNNKFTQLWWKKDLFNALYGTPPMYFFNAASYARQKGDLARSYAVAATVARATGHAQMTSHRCLTRDRAVQQTTFSNGVRVTVNFGERSYVAPDGTTLPPRSHRME